MGSIRAVDRALGTVTGAKNLSQAILAGAIHLSWLRSGDPRIHASQVEIAKSALRPARHQLRQLDFRTPQSQ